MPKAAFRYVTLFAFVDKLWFPSCAHVLMCSCARLTNLSSAYDKRRQKRIDRILKKDLEKIEKRVKKASNIEYYCIHDAKAAAEKVSQSDSELYSIATQIIEIPKYGRGRPKNGVRIPEKILYGVTSTIKENKEAISKLRDEGGCFVLTSSLPSQGDNGRGALSVLKSYKEQHGIEKNFGFLKDPAIVNSIFLKKPKRIEVLGLILLLSLLIWRLIEKAMRDHIEKTGEKITGWNNRSTDRPASFMMTTKFLNVLAIKLGDQRKLNRPFNKAQKEFLYALGIESDNFIRPRSP